MQDLRTTNGTKEQTDRFKRGLHLMNLGVAPCVGMLYKWANEHFPRLKLSNGTKIPGVEPFNEWQYRRLSFTP